MDLRRLWWIAGEVIGGLLDGVTDNDVNLRRLFARLNLTLKTLTEGGEDATDSQSVDAVSQALLFHIAQAKPGSDAVDKLRERFHLQELVPDRDALIRARGAVTGRNREFYTSLGAAVRDELALVKDALDLELRTGEAPPDSRKQIHEALLSLQDTLKMMGLGDSAQSIEKIMPTLNGGEKSDSDPQSRESLLMDLAGKLIQVESVLEEQITTLGEPLKEDHETSYIELPRHEQRRIRTHLLDETVNSLHQVQDSVRRHFNGEPSVDYTSPLEHIAGAMELIGESETASLAIKLRNALGNLLAATRAELALNPKQLESVADAVAAFELYLAGCRDQQSNRERFLEVLKDRLDNLPVGEMEVIETLAQSAETTVETTETITDETAVADLLPPVIDPELLTVFLEEFESVITVLEEQLPQWMQSQDDMLLMTDIRRGFYTLKGSGRMVGADEIGDFAWHIEEMLNAFLEGNIESPHDVSVLTGLSQAMLPIMRDRLVQEPSELTGAAIEAASQLADNIAKGDTADWAPLFEELPASLTTLFPFGASSDVEPESESLAVIEERIEAAPIDPVRKGLADNLIVLNGLIDRISRDRQSTASEEEILAVHTVANVTAEKPLGREADIATALHDFLETQRNSNKAFNETAVWTVASSLAYFEICLALHDGDREAELPEDETASIEQLKALTIEFTVAEEPQDDTLGDAIILPDETPQETTQLDAETDREALREPISESVDREIRDIFLEEATDILERCDSLLNTWRDNLSDLDIVQNLQREIHTFKGGSRMAGVSTLGDLSHSMETLLERIAGRVLPPSVSAIEILEQGCDRLNTWTEVATQGLIPQAGDTLTLFEQQVEALTADKIVTEQPAPSDDVPLESEPAETKPVEAAPTETKAAEPTPVDATPVEPTPVEPTPVEPTPVEPTPVEPTPVEPAPVDARPRSYRTSRMSWFRQASQRSVKNPGKSLQAHNTYVLMQICLTRWSIPQVRSVSSALVLNSRSAICVKT